MINTKFYGILNKTLGKRSYSSVKELMLFVKSSIYAAHINFNKKTKTYYIVPASSGSMGGGKGGGPPPPVPLLKPPTVGNNVLQSFSQLDVVDLICEGPIEGFCDSNGVDIGAFESNKGDDGRTIAMGVYLNNTVVQNDNFSFNFRRLSINVSKGDERGTMGKTWARSKVYRTVEIGKVLIGPNHGSSDNVSSIDSQAKKYNLAGWKGNNYRNNVGNAIGWYLGNSSGAADAKKYGYTHSKLQYGIDLREHTEKRNFTSWSPGHSAFSDAAFPVTHTITNSEVDYAYTTISVDSLSDTVDHGSGPGKSGHVASSKEYKVGFEIQIGINGLTNEEALNSDSFKSWLSKHGTSQTGRTVKSITRNYWIEGLVNGGAYLVDVGRAPWGTKFGKTGGANYDLETQDISEDDSMAAGRVDKVSAGKQTDKTQHDTDADYTGGHGLNKYRQFGYKGAHSSSLRQEFEAALQTAYIDPAYDDSASSKEGARSTASPYDCYELPPCDESTGFKSRYIKVTKLGREVISPLLQSSLSLKSVTEIIDEKLSMPFSAVIQQSFNSRYFNGVPERAYHLKLKKILIPSNYYPERRKTNPNPSTDLATYDGDWNGKFKEAWSDNPAWIFFDLLINNRYGLGSHVDVHKIDKWTLYKISRYCDGVDASGKFVGVDDTYQSGQKEPRYTCNIIITNEEEAYELLKSISEIFHGIAFWDGRGVSVSMDGGSNSVNSELWSQSKTYAVGDIVEYPDRSFTFFKNRKAGTNSKKPGIDKGWQEFWERTPGIETDSPSMNFTNTNVDGGVFSYSNASKASRFTVARVSYMDARDDFRKKYEYVEDKQGIKDLGIIKKNLEPLGCTSRGQAHRMGRWFFLTSTLNTEVVSFSTDYRALFLRPGNIISIADRLKNNQQKIGKVIGVGGLDGNDSQIIKLSEVVPDKVTKTDDSQGENFEIILTSLDPNYTIEYLNEQATVSVDEIDKLNNPQIARGTVELAYPSQPLNHDYVKIKKLDSGSYFSFTQKLSDSSSTKTIIPPGTDWSLITPEDNNSYKQDWSAREYKVQAVTEEEEGKYNITAVFFDKEKIGSMDQKFPVITPDLDLRSGFSQSKVVELLSPTIDEISQLNSGASQSVKIKAEGKHPPSEGFLENTMVTVIKIYKPDGTLDSTTEVNRTSGVAWSIEKSSSLTLGNEASEGVWTVEATTSAQESATNKLRTSPSNALGVSVGNFRYRAGAPEIKNVSIIRNETKLHDKNHGSGTDLSIEGSSDNFIISWEYLDIDDGNSGNGTLIDSPDKLSESPFFSGIKIGLIGLNSSGNEVGSPKWIHGLLGADSAEQSVLKSLEYTFSYSDRYATVTSDSETKFKYDNLSGYRDIRIKIIPEVQKGVYAEGDTVYDHDGNAVGTAEAGQTKYEYGSSHNVDILNPASVFDIEIEGGTIEFQFTEPLDMTIFMNGTAGNQTRSDGGGSGSSKIYYYYIDDDGVKHERVTEANGEMPAETQVGDVAYENIFDAKREILASENLSQHVDSEGRILSGDAALQIWKKVKKGTRRSKFVSGTSSQIYTHQYSNNGLKLWLVDDQVKFAEQYAGGDTSPKPGLNIHKKNFFHIVDQGQQEAGDAEYVESLGAWDSPSVLMNSSSRDTFEALMEMVNGPTANSVLAMDQIGITAGGPVADVGFIAIYQGSTSNFIPASSNLLITSAGASATVDYDEDGEAGLAADSKRYLKAKVWESHIWDGASAGLGKTEEEKIELLKDSAQDFALGDQFGGATVSFNIDESSNYTNLSDSDDAGDVRQKELFINTFGDERVVGYKQFYNGLIIGGTEKWNPNTSDLDFENPDAFNLLPAAGTGYYDDKGRQQSFPVGSRKKGSPVGIGEHDITNINEFNYVNTIGDGNSKDVEKFQLGQVSSLRDYHVSIKGMNLTCEVGEKDEYAGSGGLISGNNVQTPGMRAGNNVDFNNLPTISNQGLANVLTGENPVQTFVDDEIKAKALPPDALTRTTYTEDLVISGGGRIAVSGTKMLFEANGVLYEITGKIAGA